MKRWQRIWLPAVAVLMAVAGYVYLQLPAKPLQPDMDQVRREASDGGYRLIDTEALRKRMASDPGLLLVDTRQGWEYRSGHIEGAVSFPMEPTWWGRWKKRSALEAFLGKDRGKTIVFY